MACFRKHNKIFRRLVSLQLRTCSWRIGEEEENRPVSVRDREWAARIGWVLKDQQHSILGSSRDQLAFEVVVGRDGDLNLSSLTLK